MAMFGLGSMELLILLLMSTSGQEPDTLSFFPAKDYFELRGIKTDADKLLALASQDPDTPKAQVQQLQALRMLAENPKLIENAAAMAMIEAIAAGTKAQDKTGFAKKYAQLVLAAARDLTLESPPVKARAVDALEWFPADNTVAAAIDVRLTRIPGLPPRAAEPFFWRLIPEKVRRDILTPYFDVIEQTGNIEVQRGGFAMNALGPGQSRICVRISGKFRQDWIIKTVSPFLEKDKQGKIQEATGPGGERYAYVEVDGGTVVFAILNDSELLMATAARSGDKAKAVLDEMFQVKAGKKASVTKGNLKGLLGKVPDSSFAFVVAELPELMRKEMTLPDAAMPEKVVAFVGPALKALDIQVELLMSNKDDTTKTVKK